jgi:hypothetical protein
MECRSVGQCGVPNATIRIDAAFDRALAAVSGGDAIGLLA